MNVINTTIQNPRVLPKTRIITKVPAIAWSFRQRLQIATVIGWILLSAFAVIYSKELSRQLFIDYQNMQTQHNQLNVVNGELLLERGVWAAQARLQTIAERQLDMQIPDANYVIVVKD